MKGNVEAKVLMLLAATNKPFTLVSIARQLDIDVYFVACACKVLNDRALIAMTRVEIDLTLFKTGIKEEAIGFVIPETVSDECQRLIGNHIQGYKNAIHT